MMLRDRKSLGEIYLQDEIILDSREISSDHGYNQSRMIVEC
jgi:hypothetical protein